MDPNANLAEQQTILDNDTIDRARLRELREALADWLANGGFEPNWTAYSASSAYHLWYRRATRLG